MRLAVIDHLAARGFIGPGQRAGAIDQPAAALDDDVGIGADHREATPRHRVQHGPIILGRFSVVVEQPRAQHKGCLFRRHAVDREARKQPPVALGPEMKQR